MSSATRSSHATPRSRTPGRDSSPSTTPTGGIARCSSPATPSRAWRAWRATTLSLSPRSSSTVTIVSRSARDATSTWSSLTSTTRTSQPSASTSTPSPSSQKSTSPAAAATSRVLITPPFSSPFPTTRSTRTTPRRSASTPSTTTFSVSCLVWVDLLTATKRTVFTVQNFLFSVFFGKYSRTKNLNKTKFSYVSI